MVNSRSFFEPDLSQMSTTLARYGLWYVLFGPVGFTAYSLLLKIHAAGQEASTSLESKYDDLSATCDLLQKP